MAFLRENPSLFAAMALFACAWALILSYYTISFHRLQELAALPDYDQFTAKIVGGNGEQDQLTEDFADLVTDFASFLFVYIGGLFLLPPGRRARSQTSNKHSVYSAPRAVAACIYSRTQDI